MALAMAKGSVEISIHALCEEGDHKKGDKAMLDKLFLSTPSARRATALSCITFFWPLDFYPRPLRGGRPGRFR